MLSMYLCDSSLMFFPHYSVDFTIVIEDGLKSGEKVVVAGFQKIANGMTVAPNLVK